MIKKILYFLAIVQLLSSEVSSQNFILSNFLTSNSKVRTAELKRVTDGVIVYGDFVGTLNVPGTYTANVRDVFLAKYDNNFELVWLQQIGGTLIDWAFDIEIHDNYIYAVGIYKGTCTFDGGTEELTAVGSNFDAFLAKFKLDGTFVWAKPYVYNEAVQYATAIDVDKNDDLLIGGYYSDSITFENDKFISGNGMFFSKADTSGTITWAKNIPSDNTNTKIQAISAFDDGYYFTGNVEGSATFDVGGITSNDALYSDVFLYKTDFNGTGSWLRRSYGYGSADTRTGTITGDEYGNVYYSGLYGGTYIEVDSTNLLKSNKTLVNNGSFDAFIFKYNKTGNLIWHYNYGQKGQEWARGLKYQNGFLYLVGYFSDTIFFKNDTITSGALDDNDAMLAMFDAEGNAIKGVNIEDSNDGTTSGIALSVDSENNVYWGGDFKASQINIGDSTFNLSGTQSIFISKYKPTFTVAFTKKQHVTCNGGNDGKLIVTPFFGVPPFTYEWSHPAGTNDSTASNLSAGVYVVTVTDGIDSVDVSQYTLTEPGAFIFNPVITQVTTCSYSQEGAIDLNVTGGNGSNTYQWFESDGGSGVVLTAEDQSGLTTGTYSVTVTDSESCTGDTVIYITGPDPITFGGSVVTDSSGLGGPGAIDLVCSGGFGDPASFTFYWQGPTGPPTHSEDTSNLSPGNYSVTVTDLHLCEFDTMFNVANLDTFYIFISDYKDACYNTFNGNATVSYSSPDNHTAITYLWDSNASSQTTAQATGLASGRYYYVTVTDTENTPNTVLVDSVFIDDLSYNFAGSLAGTTTLDCFGDTDGYIDLSITTAGIEPYSYNWSNSETTQDITNLSIGTYSVTATDANECTFSITDYVIDQPTALAAVAEIVNSPTCNGNLDGEVTVLRNGGTVPYTYQWNDPGSQTTQNATGIDAGYYTVTVTDYNSCTAVSSINLTEPEAITIDTTVNHVSCNSGAEGSIQLTVSGGTTPFTYFWSTTNGLGLVVTDKNQSGLTAGKYYFTATDDHNCTYEDSVEITEPLLLEITNEEKTNITTCNGDNTGTITITATGGTGVLTYILNPGAIQTNNTGAFTGLLAGTYTVDVDDENGCGPVTSSSIEITEPTQISITAETPTDISCNGFTDGQIVITATGGTGALQYSIDNGTIYLASNTFSGLTASTNYQVKVQDANLCEVAGSTLIITEPTELAIDSTVIDITCNGSTDGSIDITASGGTIVYTYNWSTTDGSGLVADSEDQTGLGAGTYDLTVTDDNLCTVTASISINEPTVINLESSDAINPTCNGSTDGSIDITISGGTIATNYTYSWSTTDGSGLVADAEDQTGLGAGTYDLTVTDDNLCTVTASISINEPTVINLESSDAINPTCNGSTDGSIDITISGGTIATNYTYSWATTDGSGLVADAEDQTGLSAGTYNVTATDDNSCASAFAIVLDDPLEISIDSENSTDASSQTTADGTITVVASGGTGTLTYDLNPGDDSNITGIFNSVLPGDYTVDVTDDNSCGPVTSNTITVGFLDAIDDLIISDKIKLYPNPTSAKLNVEIDFEIDDIYKIEILTISGQVLFNKEIKSHGITKEELDLSNYPKGIYFIRIYNNQFIFKEKILLQ